MAHHFISNRLNHVRLGALNKWVRFDNRRFGLVPDRPWMRAADCGPRIDRERGIATAAALHPDSPLHSRNYSVRIGVRAQLTACGFLSGSSGNHPRTS